MLPLSVPALASLGLISFVTTWNDYLGPLIYLRDRDVWTIQIGLDKFVDQYQSQFSLVMTGAVLAIVPVVVLFLIGQRHFVQGIASTGLKG
jgi:multiple sugar transport system permease protein